MTGTCRPVPGPRRPSETESREDYLARVNRCAHDGPRRPGWPCGGCGAEWSEIDRINETESEAA